MPRANPLTIITPCRASASASSEAVLRPGSDGVRVPMMATLGCASGRPIVERGQPPEGDWLGTPYLRLEREGPLATLVIDRPERRNAMTAAMYFGVRVAVHRVDHELAV